MGGLFIPLLFLNPLAESLAAGQPTGSLPTSQFQQVSTLHPWDLLWLCLLLAPLLFPCYLHHHAVSFQIAAATVFSLLADSSGRAS